MTKSLSLLKLVTVVGVVGAIVVAPVANLRAEALTEAQALERLNSIPVFVITDDKGNPLLGSMKSGGDQQQFLLFFLNPDDARSLLGQIKSTNPELGRKSQIVVRSLNEAIQVIKKNKDKKITFQITPSKSSINSARTILASQGKSTEKLPNIPIFYATGGSSNDQGLLTIKQNGKQLVPFFMDQKDLQAMIDRAKQQQPNVASNIKIQVSSLLQVIDSMVTKDNKANPDAERFTFVPSKAAFQYILSNQPQVANSQFKYKPEAENSQVELQPQVANSQFKYQPSSFKYDQVALFNSSAIKSGDSPEVVNLKKGEVARRSRQYYEALAYYDKALEINPKFAFAVYRRGYILDELKRYQEAIQEYDRASKLLNNSSWGSIPWHGRGVSLVKTNRYQEALDSFDKALQLNQYIPPEMERDLVPADSWYGKGLALYNLRRYQESLAAFDTALKLQPGHPDATRGRATALKVVRY